MRSKILRLRAAVSRSYAWAERFGPVMLGFVPYPAGVSPREMLALPVYASRHGFAVRTCKGVFQAYKAVRI